MASCVGATFQDGARFGTDPAVLNNWWIRSAGIWEAKRPHTSTSYICIGGGVDPGGKSSGDGSSIGCGGRSSPGIGAGGMIGGIGSGICMPHQRLNWLRGAGGGERTKAGIVFELLRSRRAATE
jgi:hypothetical protein